MRADYVYRRTNCSQLLGRAAAGWSIFTNSSFEATPYFAEKRSLQHGRAVRFVGDRGYGSTQPLVRRDVDVDVDGMVAMGIECVGPDISHGSTDTILTARC